MKKEAEGAAKLDSGFRMNSLLHSPHRLPVTPKPEARVVGNTARAIRWRGIRGKVGRCLNQYGRKSYTFVPGFQQTRYSTPPVY